MVKINQHLLDQVAKQAAAQAERIVNKEIGQYGGTSADELTSRIATALRQAGHEPNETEIRSLAEKQLAQRQP